MRRIEWIAALTACTACNSITGASGLSIGAGAGGASAANASIATSGSTNDATTSTSGVASSGSGSGSTTTTTTTASATSATASTAASSSASGGATCAPMCTLGLACENGTCVCGAGSTMVGGVCAETNPGDPSTHSQQDVCDHWTSGHVLSDPSPFSGSGMMCDPGSLSAGGISDTLARLDMFRWFVGLGPVADDPSLDSADQQCANLEAFWDFSSPDSPHMPPSTTACYTAQGGSAAGQSNIDWGSGGPAQAIDDWMQDTGNDTTLGHRRWIMYPPLDPIGIGYWQTGGMYGNSACMNVFSASGTGPNPPWVAVPNPGYAVIDTAQWTWSFHGSLGGLANATASVVRVDDNTTLPVTMMPLSQGYGQDAISWVPNGWQVEAGKTYQVTISGLSSGNVVYEVKPIACN